MRQKQDVFLSVFAVALLAEGVDRNEKRHDHVMRDIVALLAEGVDRNQSCNCACKVVARRPPRGGRG